MRGLTDVELLELLETFAVAIDELEALNDEGVNGLLRRLQQRRREVAEALAARPSVATRGGGEPVVVPWRRANGGSG